jgi:chemotaxis protein CheX
MDVRNVEPFLNAVGSVMPVLGFRSVKRGRVKVCESSKVPSLGVMVVIGLTQQLRGAIAYSMTEDSARKIASTMMMGMPVDAFDAMAQSAIAELGNMLAANASMILERQGAKLNISPPTVVTGKGFASTEGGAKALNIEMFVDEIPLEVNVAIAS